MKVLNIFILLATITRASARGLRLEDDMSRLLGAAAEEEDRQLQNNCKCNEGGYQKFYNKKCRKSRCPVSCSGTCPGVKVHFYPNNDTSGRVKCQNVCAPNPETLNLPAYKDLWRCGYCPGV